MIRPTLLVVLMAAAGVAQAQGMPRGPAPPPPGHGDGPRPPGAPSPEALATIPDLTAQQQAEVRRILIQRRDAHEALHAKEESDREAAMTRARAEHERIDDDSSARLRKLLGDDGYRSLAQWLAQGPRGLGREHGPDRGPRPGGARPPVDGKAPPPAVGAIGPGPAPDDEDAMPPVAQ